jgi:hypothetical protein
LADGWSRCSGGGAVYHYGFTTVGECNFTDDAVTHGGCDIWSYGESATITRALFRRGRAPVGMVYSVYQADLVNVSDSIFMDSTSFAFHSHGSTGGSVIIASGCYFKDVGGFDSGPVPDTWIVLIDCEFSNESVWTAGSVLFNGSRLHVTRNVDVHPPVVDRECVWYADHQALFPTATRSRTGRETDTPSATATMRRSPNATWARPPPTPDEGTWTLVIAMLGAIGVAALVIVVIGVIAIKRKPPEPEEAIEDGILPYTE